MRSASDNLAAPTYAAKLAPLQPETVWTLEPDALVERRGARERRLALAELRTIRASTTGAELRFRRGRMAIPAFGYGGFRPQDQAASFAPFLAALLAAAQAAAPRARLLAEPARPVEPVAWTMALMGAGAAALMLFAALTGAWALGVALAARMVFVLILAGAILPWLGRAQR